MLIFLAWVAVTALVWTPFFWCCCPPPTCATATIGVVGCFSGPITGADVTVTLGGATILSANTGAGSSVATAALESGTYDWTVTHPSGRVNSASGSFTITCPQGNITVTATLSPATGYHCYCGNTGTNQGLPVTDTLNASLSTGETFTMTYDSGSSQWVGSVDVDWPGCLPGDPILGCPADTVSLEFRTPVTRMSCTGATSCQVGVSATPATQTPCGVNMIGSGVDCMTINAGLPSLNITAVVNGAVFGTCNAAPLDPAGEATLTITE